MKIQDPSGLQSEFKGSLGNLVNLISKEKGKGGLARVGSQWQSICLVGMRSWVSSFILQGGKIK